MTVTSCPTRKIFAFSCSGSNFAQIEYPQRRIITKHTFRGSGFLPVFPTFTAIDRKGNTVLYSWSGFNSVQFEYPQRHLKKKSGFSEIFTKIIITFKCREIFRTLEQLLIRFRSYCIVFVNSNVSVLSTAMLRCEVQDQWGDVDTPRVVRLRVALQPHVHRVLRHRRPQALAVRHVLRLVSRPPHRRPRSPLPATVPAPQATGAQGLSQQRLPAHGRRSRALALRTRVSNVLWQPFSSDHTGFSFCSRVTHIHFFETVTSTK